MRDLSIWVVHEWGVGVKELIKLELVHELVGPCSISREDCRFFSF
jgi:hypothetical protein